MIYISVSYPQNLTTLKMMLLCETRFLMLAVFIMIILSGFYSYV